MPNLSSLVWVVVGMLAIVALILWIAPHVNFS